MKLEELEEKLGYHFQDRRLLEQGAGPLPQLLRERAAHGQASE